MCEECVKRQKVRSMYMEASDRMACDEVQIGTLTGAMRTMTIMATNTMFGRVALLEQGGTSREKRLKGIDALYEAGVAALEEMRAMAHDAMDGKEKDEGIDLTGLSVH